MRAALAEYDVAGDDKLGGAFFGAEASARALGGFVGAAFRGVRGGAGEEKEVVGGGSEGARRMRLVVVKKKGEVSGERAVGEAGRHGGRSVFGGRCG